MERTNSPAKKINIFSNLTKNIQMISISGDLHQSRNSDLVIEHPEDKIPKVKSNQKRTNLPKTGEIENISESQSFNKKDIDHEEVQMIEKR